MNEANMPMASNSEADASSVTSDPPSLENRSAANSSSSSNSSRDGSVSEDHVPNRKYHPGDPNRKVIQEKDTAPHQDDATEWMDDGWKCNEA